MISDLKFLQITFSSRYINVHKLKSIIRYNAVLDELSVLDCFLSYVEKVPNSLGEEILNTKLSRK